MTHTMNPMPPSRRVRELEERVAQLESEIAELRRHHLRVAELADLVTELVVPLADRDPERVERAIAAFNQSL
ncbi:DUF6752 domain-containing protein [Nocardioides sambongensis]|uniref:DUF6752 domain-containing protein n=1 Tax=Nocardioides sambongensis TaxID=2589074 RepID=UPI0011270AE9|nr:DUF6752 domain-containing protein [Nocardioides sambongensis]